MDHRLVWKEPPDKLAAILFPQSIDRFEESNQNLSSSLLPFQFAKRNFKLLGVPRR